MNESPGFRIPPYLCVDRPAHFRARADLIEEMCVADTMERTLPRTARQHAGWLEYWGLVDEQAPFAQLRPLASQPYQATHRYLLRPVILPSKTHVLNSITDARGWSAPCEFGGLWDFVHNRAIEFARWYGLDETTARQMLVPTCAKGEASTSPQYATWAIGYERGTGLCTILARRHRKTEELYLARQGGYYTPYPDRDDPIF